ncbi:hypothetical protein [Microbacterium sp. YY-01]|uniref:hypothetical protein n=1 Tax=Microbacterium sp. YY-01 TaxID=3421634 RepID=UPI003D185157
MTSYLRSTAWFSRRDRWFKTEQERAGKIQCAVCMKSGSKRDFELHHLDYTGVQEIGNGVWLANEEHGDLVAVHPRCHEWLHRALDADPAAGSASTRRQANERVIAGLRARIVNYLKGL